jgi:tetratricopeptide (TPR) repeat protein
MKSLTRWRLSTLLAAAGLLIPVAVSAQLEDRYQQTEVQQVGDEQPEEQRESTRARIEGESRVSERWFEEELDISQLEQQDTAMNRLRRLVENATPSSEQRADYMFRLAELYYIKARGYEQRAYTRRDRAFEFMDSNPARAEQYELSAEEDLVQADQYATLAVEVYAELYEDYHDTYPAMDAVLYYLGSTLSQLGMNEEALGFFEELANDYPSSVYLPRALLAFGEYYFQLGDMQRAQQYYHAVAEFPESQVYPYALYQEAWCFYNTADFDQAVQRLLDAVEASAGDSAGRIRMRQRAMHDLALFYPEIGSAEDAIAFFQAVGDANWVESVELVARIFSEDGNYAAGNYLFRELMAERREYFDIVRYQEEIVRNTLPSEDPVEIVREVRRLAEIYQAARNFPNADPTEVQEAGQRIEYQVRHLATTYHREAQVLNNDRRYALAYNLYEDYHNGLAESADLNTRYLMAYYYADLLYLNERYEDSAAMFESCLEIDPNGEYNEEAIYKAVLAYTKLVDFDQTPPVTDVSADQELTLAPEPVELPPVMQRLVAAARRYMDTNPRDEDAAQVLYVAARVLYDYFHFAESVEIFGQVALDYYAADNQRADVSARLLLDALNGMRDFDAMETWARRLLEAPVGRVEPLRTYLQNIIGDLSFTRCYGVYESREWEDAGLCFFGFVQERPDSELVDRALYNAARAFAQAGQLQRVLRCNELLAQLRPDSELAPQAQLEVARTYHNLALFRDAAQEYETYARTYSSQEDAQDALANAALFRRGLGEYDQAIEDYETFIELFSREREKVAEAVFQIGLIYHERGEFRQARRQFERYLDDFARQGRPGLAIQAATRMGLLADQLGLRDGEQWYVDALDRYNGLDDDTRNQLDPISLDAAAEARFMLGERIFVQVSAVTLEGRENQMQERLREKAELGRQAAQVYEQVRAFARPGWGIAAFTRLGQLYHEFYDAIVNAPLPEGMSFEVEEAYLSMLEEQATEVRLQAVQFYETALEIARQAGWFNEYSELAEQNLAQLDPSFRAGNELRARPVYEPSGYYPATFIQVLGGDEEESPEGDGEGAPAEEPATVSDAGAEDAR